MLCFFAVCAEETVSTKAPAEKVASVPAKKEVPEEPSSTKKYKLDNGLTVIVRPDHRSPIATVQVWYGVGSSDEPNGITGISHALEHMMFRGTSKYPENTFSRFIAINGGDNNAMTAEDFTAYYQDIGVEQIPLCFELEADRMVNLTLPENSFKQEIKVVKEERRLRIDDNPDLLTYERLRAAALTNNPYHHMPIGWMNDLDNMTVEDLKTWYKTWYGPNNAVLVVVGDVEPDNIHQLAKTYFGSLKSISLPTRKPRLELPSIGQKRIQVQDNGTVPRLMMAYNVPTLSTTTDPKEPYALLVLLMALDGGNSSRISRELIRGQSLMTSVFSMYDPFEKHETLLFISGVPTQTHTLDEIEKAFLQEIGQLQAEPISEQELNRVKANVIASHTFQKDSMSHQAIQLGMMEILGYSWELADTYPDKIKAITAADVQAVAKKYLVPQRLTIAEFIPTNTTTETGN